MITKDLMRQIRMEVDTHLALVGAKHGLKMQLAKGTWWTERAQFKLEIFDLKEGEKTGVSNQLEADFKNQAYIFGLQSDWLHKTYTDQLDGRRYEIMGLKTRGRVRPIVIKDCFTGKQYVTQAKRVKTAMEGIK